MKKPEINIIADIRHGRDITRGYVDNLPLLQPTDPVLRSKYSSLWNAEAYREVLVDDQVISVVKQRQMAVVAKEFHVVAGGKRQVDKAAADFLHEQLVGVRWDTVTEAMLYARFFGYSVAECMWGRDGRHITLDRLRVRNHSRFGFSPDFELRLLTTKAPMGEALPEHKFWWCSTGADHDDEPYGLGLGHYCYWPAYFKREGLAVWLQFLEKFASPTPKGTLPAGGTEQDKQALMTALQSVHKSDAIVVPEGVVVELIEAGRSGTAGYPELQRLMNEAISKIVLGQTMTTDSGSSRSQAEVHLTVRDDLVRADAMLLNDSFNRSVVKWLMGWNYPTAALPMVSRRIEPPVDLMKQARRDSLLFNMGYRPTKKYIEETYGLEVDDMPPAPAPDAPTADQSETRDLAEQEDFEEALDAALDAMDEDSLRDMNGALLKPLLAMAEDDPDEFIARMGEAYPDMEIDQLTETLARVLYVAELWGAANAGEG